MEIGGLHNQQKTLNETTNQVKVQKTEANIAQQQTGKAVTAETITLTDAASNLRNLETRLSKSPVIDNQRVEDVKTALENGTYKVDPEKIAQKLFDFEAELENL